MFDKKYKYVAMDEDGFCKFFIEKPAPNLDTFCWYANDYSASVISKGVFNLGNDWKESLREIVHNDDGSVYLRKPRYDFKVDDKVLVRDYATMWVRRHFSHYNLNGGVECFAEGRTSFTREHPTVVWDEIKPYVEE